MDPATYTDTKSPTVGLVMLFIMSAISAKEGREIATLDIGNAFVKADMKGEEEVLVALDKLSTAILIKIDSSYEKFVNRNGEIVVKLNKALYGCVQSARLWFDTLTTELRSYGYVHNSHDPCVMNKTVDGKQSTLLIHVDDIKILSQIKGEVKMLYDSLLKKFEKVNYHDGL